ncbi:MAG TPA: hypothetical protein VGY66_08130 [Gemmataceae bacterium]|jgi:hypothetical protein|nr:hypothetical protein [Gemmataceae bacterium]
MEKSLLRKNPNPEEVCNERRYRLPNGREVYLGRFAVEATYSGLIEGSLEQGSRMILRGLAETAAKSLGSDNPLVVVNPGVIPLPRYHLGARLFSTTGVKISHPNYKSRLFVSWFVDSLASTIDALVESVLPKVDWEANAADYDITDF